MNAYPAIAGCIHVPLMPNFELLRSARAELAKQPTATC
jgi:hypothetical protein